VAPASIDNHPDNQNMLSSDKSLAPGSGSARKPFALRIETIRRIFEVIEERFAEVMTVSKKICLGDGRFSCPIHGHNRFVVNNGHDTNGVQKCICKGKHEKENVICLHVAPSVKFVVYREVTSADGRLYFRSTTSYDALQLYARCLKLSLDMVLNGATIEFVMEFLGFSKALIEKALDMLARIEPRINVPDSVDSEDLVVVYLDFSSSAISRVYGITAAVVNGQPTLFVSVGESYMQAYSVLKALREALEEKICLEDKVVVLITDGSQAYPIAVREIFPKAIHVRQIHDKNQRGIILVHFSVPSGHEYTIRMRWDAFSSKPYDGPILDLEEKDSAELYLGRLDVGDPHGFLRGKNRRQEERREPSIGSKFREATLIFRGSLEEMKRKFHFVCWILVVLATLFAGKFITTNGVEPYFTVKAAIRRHRVTRGYARILRCLLIRHSKQWKLSSSRKTIVLNMSSRKASRPPPKMRIIADAVKTNRDLLITYLDRRENSTYRLITPCELYAVGNTVYLRAYCHLRNAYRTFRVDRICHVETVS